MYIKVKVFPQSKKDQVIRKSVDSYLLKVAEKAEGGAANRKVKSMLALHFKVSEAKVRLVKGGKKPNKIFEIY